MSDEFVYQASPPGTVIYVEIERGVDYPDVDFTTVTTVTAQVYLPGVSEVGEWTFDVVGGETTESVLVCSRELEEADTEKAGFISMRLTPYADIMPLPSTPPLRLPVRAWP